MFGSGLPDPLRIIPAYAGLTRALELEESGKRDHPRLRGVNGAV